MKNQVISNIDKIKSVDAVPRDKLASRSRRFIAASIDILIYVVIFLTLNKVLFGNNLVSAYSLERLYLAISAFFIYFLCNYKFLIKGQTIGEKILRIRIVTTQNKIPSLFNVFIIRHILFVCVVFLIDYLNYYFLHITLLNYICLINYLLIFGKKKRCLHDYLAHTMVLYEL
ncbi:MAG: RDD family protein [Cloacibacillus sp.]|nr:RDD family protein [Cloacibacillus sp.]